MRTRLLLTSFLFCWHLAKAQNPVTLSPKEIKTIELRTTQNKKLFISMDKPAVFIMLSPDCPLSKNYAPVLNDLVRKHPTVSFYGIFPGRSYTPAEIDQFKKEFAISFPVLRDPLMQLSRYLKARVTPEVFLVSPAGHVLYSGLVDNWAVSLGKKRQVVTAHYLEDALTGYETQKKIIVKRTDPVGCLINDI